jgi:hypothetical protein
VKRLGLLFLLFVLLMTPSVSRADWRWHGPIFKPHKVTYSCATLQCIRHTYVKEKRRYKKRVARYNRRRLNEWKYWSTRYIPDCTWYGESGTGPRYARYRYTMPNAMGSGAYGKYQMMPGTYHSRAKYHDWSPLDQEIAAHREYWANGTSPWANC